MCAVAGRDQAGRASRRLDLWTWISFGGLRLQPGPSPARAPRQSALAQLPTFLATRTSIRFAG
eukprot:scaffold10064_cov130-Isochrysis_galbana.AAC.7